MAAYAFAAAKEEDTHEPVTYQEAVACEDSSKWKAAMEEEMDSLTKNKTWELVDPPAGQKLVSSKWLFKIKEGIEGFQNPRYKARLVARGFTQRAGIDYNEVFSPVVRHTSIRVILALTACKDYELEQLDVKTAFYMGILKNSHLGNGIKDDMLIACKSKAEIGSTKSLLKKEFDMKKLGEAKKILDVIGWALQAVVEGFPVKDCDVEKDEKDPDKGRSITGYVFLVQGCVVSWKEMLQYVVALSTTEAKYMALTEAVKEAIWLRGLLEELGVKLNTVAVNCDNQGEVLEAKTVKVLKVGEHNAADALIKVVPGWKLQHCLEFSNNGIYAMLENGHWFIHTSLILEKWTPDANLLKEDVEAAKKVDDPVNVDSDSEAEKVFNNIAGIMASTSSKVNKSGSGVGNKSLYEQWKPSQRVFLREFWWERMRCVFLIFSMLDDTIFFGEWDRDNAQNLMCILKCFEEASGLKVNLNKSRLYGVGVSSGEEEDMARHMCCSVGEFPFMYLGLQIDANMIRVTSWRPVVEKVKKRLSEWRDKTMSFGGRLETRYEVWKGCLKATAKPQGTKGFLEALELKGGDEGACKLIRRLLGKVIEVLEVLGCMIEALCKQGKIKEAKDVIDIMVKSGWYPDIVIFNSLIDGYSLLGDMPEARNTFDLLLVATYNKVMDGYGKNFILDVAYDFFFNITVEGIDINEVTHCILRLGSLAESELEERYRVSKDGKL
ncbi:retrotransposon protein, putative, ty1-copia subclass [Tanacetum coccineum]